MNAKRSRRCAGVLAVLAVAAGAWLASAGMGCAALVGGAAGAGAGYIAGHEAAEDEHEDRHD